MTCVPKSPTLFGFTMFVFIILFAPPSLSDIPKVINYQGKVTDTGGTPVADGTYSMQFRIYDAETAGNLEWDSGSVSADVSVGVFEVLLGDSPQPTLDLSFDEDYWIEVQVDSDIQSPRVKLGSVGYAYMASGLAPGTVVEGSVTTGTAAAFKAVNAAASGTTYGVYGESHSSYGRGVYGYASHDFETTIGVYGESSSMVGMGVYGYASQGTGANYGVYGESSSMAGTGVYAKASATSGGTYGAFGWSTSTSGCGVAGLATASTGSTLGVSGYSNSPSGVGVYGYCTASSGTPHGVYGRCASPTGHGVAGLATATTGSAIGVSGTSQSSEGKGVFGYVSATTGTVHGIYGQSLSSTGYGVYGYNPGGWAGGFNGDVDLNGRLVLPDNDATGITGSGSIEIGSSLRIDGNEIITNTNDVLYLQRDNNGDLDIDGSTLIVDASADRVGVGTPSPGATLHINGQMRLGAGSRAFELREVTTSDAWGSGIISYDGIGIGSNDGNNRQMTMFTDGSGAQNIFTVATSENNGASWDADFVVQQNGRVGVGTDSPGYTLQVGTNGDGTEARANAWNLLSSRKYKSGITPLQEDEYSELLKQLVETDVVRYRFYQDEKKTQHLGIIAEDAPPDIVTRDGEALSLSDYCAFLLAAAKAQQEEIEVLKARISQLEGR